jgi:Domain of unknown function (DUF3597)
MSVLGNIVSAIFPSSHTPSGTAAAKPSTTTSSPAPPSAGLAPAKPISLNDLQNDLEKLAANQAEKLDWKVSIVDLMKLLKLDSSLGERKKLAQELGYAGALDGSAEMNTWLHKQVMTKVAESGGRVPENLKA